jgi:uncharacterized protein YfdQ (DUF2303 family)
VSLNPTPTDSCAQDFKRVLFEDIGEAALLTIGTFTP